MKAKKRHVCILFYETFHLFFLLFFSAGQLRQMPVALYAAAPLLIVQPLLAWMRIAFCEQEAQEILITKLFGLTKLLQTIGIAGWIFSIFTLPSFSLSSYSAFFVLLMLIFIVFNGILSIGALKANGEICK